MTERIGDVREPRIYRRRMRWIPTITMAIAACSPTPHEQTTTASEMVGEDRSVEPKTVATAPKDPEQPRVIEEGVTKVMLVDHQFACFDDDGLRLCGGSIGDCEQIAARTKPNSPCRPTDAVACFQSTQVVSGKRTIICYEQMTACQSMNATLSGADTKNSPCFVMRYEP